MDNKKKIYGLIGCPVKHSLSSYMHNAAFESLGIEAHYELFEVQPDKLGDFLSSLSEKNIYGFNVTIPYKEKVLDFVRLDKDAIFARQIKAINTIVKSNGEWKGYNTDAPGFLKHLKEQVDPSNKKVAILGAGGAGKAVTYAIIQSNAQEVVIYDIDKNKSKSLVEAIKEAGFKSDVYYVENIEELKLSGKNLLINATPVGMKDSDSCLVKEEMLHKDLFVYDVIYNPFETKLLKLAKKVGAKFSNGLGMLLYQGVLAFEIWTGKKAPQEVMWKALSSHISFN